MKHLTKYMMLALFFLPLLSSCSDDEKEGEGSPVIVAENLQPAMFGDSITLKVNCSDEAGIPLSTLKAQLCYGDEVVDNVTLRTKTEGEYTVKLYAPFYKNVPDGEAEVRLTLQNIRLAISTKTVTVDLSRPHYEYITLMASDGNQYRLTPDASDPYLFKGTVTSSSRNVTGYILTPSTGTDNVPQTFGQGTEGVTQGVTDNLTFSSTAAGTFDVWFNVLTYEFGPQSDIPVITLTDADGANVYVGEFTQNTVYEITGSDKFAEDSWYYDPDFFQKNADGTFTFLPMSGMYTLKADFTNGGFRVWQMADTENTATLSADGSGALWVIGSDCICKPTYAQISGQGWWTDTDHALCLAPIKDKVYQITLTIGKQLQADGSNLNFKFFGQAGWGIEFKGSGGTYYLTTDSNIFAVGDGTTEYQGGHDDGNIYLRPGVTLTDGDTYVFTVDLTEGTDKGKLIVEKK